MRSGSAFLFEPLRREDRVDCCVDDCDVDVGAD